MNEDDSRPDFKRSTDGPARLTQTISMYPADKKRLATLKRLLSGRHGDEPQYTASDVIRWALKLALHVVKSEITEAEKRSKGGK